MKHSVDRRWLDYVSCNPFSDTKGGKLLVVDYITLGTLISWNRRWIKHGFYFYQVWPELRGNTNGEPWLPLIGDPADTEEQAEFVAGLDTKELRDAYENRVNPYKEDKYRWVAVAMNLNLVSFALPPVLGVTKPLTRQQEPKVMVGFHLTAAELARLDVARLVGESRGASVIRHLRPIIQPEVNSPVSPPPETT